LSDIYGDNKLGKVKENIKANKSSGFKGNQQLLAFVNDLYSDYNMIIISLSLTKVLPAHIHTGIDVYNYVLRDSAYINKNGVTTSCSIQDVRMN
jgi:hypothetical protein